MKQLCLYHNSLAKERDKPMRAEDDEMSNALMNDMADALRSAGLGSMVHSDEVEPEPETPSEIVVEEEQELPVETSSDEELTVEEQVQSLIEEGEYKSRSNAPQEALVAFNKAIALDPSSDMAWFNRGVLLEAQQGCSWCTASIPNLSRPQSRPCSSNSKFGNFARSNR